MIHLFNRSLKLFEIEVEVDFLGQKILITQLVEARSRQDAIKAAKHKTQELTKMSVKKTKSLGETRG